MEASAEPRAASAGRWKAMTLLAAVAWGGLLPAGGRTSAVGVIRRVVPSSPRHSQATQLVSTKALGEVHRRSMTPIGAPQVGQRAASGFGGGRGGGWPALGWAWTIMRRMGAGGMAQLAWSTPQWRTCMTPCGKTCWRKLRIHALTSRWAVRRRALPPCREVTVTVRSVRPTIRLLERATLKTYGAREVKAEGPWGWA
jgi:hypothetical protein